MKVGFNKIKVGLCLSDERRSFYNYQLACHRRYIGTVALVFGIFNALLLIPDFILIGDMSKKTVILLFRVLFSGMLFLLFRRSEKIKGITAFLNIITAFEFLAIAEFLLVLNLYNQPNFMIQAMGMLIINIAVFLIPNRWLNMLVVSILGTAGFLIYAALFMRSSDSGEFWAGAVYLCLALLLCSLFALELDQHQFNEFTAKRELITLSSTDQLTRAWNRKKLFDEFSRLQESHRDSQLPLTLVLMDIDKFKSINDQNGHSVADAVLVEMVDLINRHLRSTDILVRWGGDEFILLFPNTELETAAGILERIRKTIEKSTFAGSVKITCSFGAVEKKGSIDLDVMVEQADNLMYAAKSLGGNHVLHNP